MDKKQALTIAVDGADFLEKMIKPSGRFVYGYKNPNTDKEISGYNILRHAGCIWALMVVYDIVSKKEYKDKAKLAIDYMIESFMQDYKGTKMVVEDGYAKLGGNGLALLAILKWNKGKSKKYNNICIDLSRYITRHCLDYNGQYLYHKRDVKYDVDKGFISEFYPGEATLALCETQKQLNVDYGDEIRKAIQYNYNLRESLHHIRDHWMMQAIESFNPDSFRDYADKITKKELLKWPKRKPGPTACRSEAVISHLYTKPTKGIRKKIEKFLKESLEFQASMQLKKGRHKGGFLWSIDDKTLRNDVTQHNICSFLRYSQLK
jgi:hypothetical protein